MRSERHKRVTQAKKPTLPPAQAGIPARVEAQVIALTTSGFGGARLIGRETGISYTSVWRIWKRHGINRKQIQRRDELVEQHKPLALRIAKSVAHDLPVGLRSDLSGVALAALVNVAANYDPSHGASFSTYAQQRIRGACLDSIRRRHYVAGTSSEFTQEASESRVESGASAEDVMIDQQEHSETRTRLIAQLAKLPGRLAVITWLHYMESRTIEQIAVDMGVGASRVSQLHTEALGLMREGIGAR